MTLALVLLAVALGAAAQTVSGIGFVLVCGPALVALLGPDEGVRLAVLLSFGVNVVVLAREHRHADRRTALLLLLPALVTTPVVAAAVRHAPERVMEAVAGSLAALAAGALAAGLRARALEGTGGALLAGGLSGAMNAAAGIGGPAAALWTANAGWEPSRSRPTLQVYFLGLNLVTLLSLGAPDQPATTLGAAVAALAAGLAVGHALSPRVPHTTARHVTLGLAAAGGAVVLLRAVLP